MYDSLTLAAVIAELEREAIGLRVNKVRQPDELTLVLHLGAAGGVRQKILISAQPNAARLHLLSDAPANLDVPPKFSHKARPLLEGARFIEALQIDFDRIAKLAFEKGPRIYTLIVEIMGRRSNIILTDEADHILDAAKRVSIKDSPSRPVVPGRKYALPPGGDRLTPLTATPSQIEALVERAPRDEPLATFLHRAYHGFSKDLVAEFAARIGCDPQAATAGLDLNRLIQTFAWLSNTVTARTFEPVVYFDEDGIPIDCRPTPKTGVSTQFKRSATMSEAVELCHSTSRQTGVLSKHRNEIIQSIHGEIKRLQKTHKEIERELESNKDFEQLRRRGELLLINIHNVTRGASSVTVIDAYDPDQSEVTIEIASDKSPQENADQYFTKARKAERALAHGERRRGETESTLSSLAEIIERAEHATSVEELVTLRDAAYERGVPTPQAAIPEQVRRERDELSAKGIRRITSSDGFEILWGKSATGNDYLTVHASASNDIWLHARGCTSAHVVIRTNGDPDRVPRTTIEEAARIAAKTSEAKHSSVVPVDYTLRKYVRRMRKGKPGLVQYEREQTIHIEP